MAQPVLELQEMTASKILKEIRTDGAWTDATLKSGRPEKKDLLDTIEHEILRGLMDYEDLRERYET